MVTALVFLVAIFLLGVFNSLLSLPLTGKTMAWFSSLFMALSPLPKPSTNYKALPSQQPRPKATNEAELRRVFSTFDHNGDGLIARQELQDSLENLGLFVSDADLDSMVARLDTNGDGFLDLQEFCVLYESVNVSGEGDRGANGGDDGEQKEGQVVEDEELKEAFDVFDVNGDGFITVEELGSVLSSMGLKRRAGRTQLIEMIGSVDGDGDGRVSFAEFQQMMKADALA